MSSIAAHLHPKLLEVGHERNLGPVVGRIFDRRLALFAHVVAEHLRASIRRPSKRASNPQDVLIAWKARRTGTKSGMGGWAGDAVAKGDGGKRGDAGREQTGGRPSPACTSCLRRSRRSRR